MSASQNMMGTEFEELLSSQERDKGTLLFERRYNDKVVKIYMESDGRLNNILADLEDNWLYETNSDPGGYLPLTDSLIDSVAETLIGAVAVCNAVKANGWGPYDTRDKHIDKRIDECTRVLIRQEAAYGDTRRADG